MAESQDDGGGIRQEATIPPAEAIVKCYVGTANIYLGFLLELLQR